jgi:hypothetical protein
MAQPHRQPQKPKTQPTHALSPATPNCDAMTDERLSLP